MAQIFKLFVEERCSMEGTVFMCNECGGVEFLVYDGAKHYECSTCGAFHSRNEFINVVDREDVKDAE